MGFGKFISNATKAVGKTAKVVSRKATNTVKKVERTATKAVATGAKQAFKGVKKAGSAVAVAAGKGIQQGTKTIGKVGIGKVNVANAAKAITKVGVGNVNLANASNELKKGIAKVSGIPVLGPVIGATTGIHIVNAVNNIARGQRVDRAALSVFKNKIKDYKEVAPYAASVVSFVPGIGPGVGAGIAAGAALAEGKRWDEIAIEAAKGAIPGGAIAKAVFDAAQAAARGKPLDQIGIAALPINDKAKAAIAAGVALTKDLAAGKRVDQALLNRVEDALRIAGVQGQAAQGIASGAQLARDLAAGKDIGPALIARVDDAMKIAGPEVMKALQVGGAIGTARKLQDSIMKEIATPKAKEALALLGVDAIKRLPALQQGLKLSNDPAFKQGFTLASGIMSGKKVDEAMLLGLRNSLVGEARKGFDSATSYFIGKHQVSQKPIQRQNPPSRPGIADKKATPAQSFAYFATNGLVGAAQSQKTAIVSQMTQTAEMKAGAADAIRAVAADRAIPRKERSFWENLAAWVTARDLGKQLPA